MGRQIKDADYVLPYGTGCYKIVNGKKELFCDDCENCPLKDCEASHEPWSKLYFNMMHLIKRKENVD
jgi:hypothetical protein